MLHRVLHGLLGDLVEGEAKNLPLLAGQLLSKMPADRFTLAVWIRCDVDVCRLLGRVLELLDHFLPRFNGLVLFREVVVDIDTQFALGQIADVTH